MNVPRGNKSFILTSLLDEKQEHLAGKMVAIIGHPGVIRNDLVLCQLSSVSSNKNVMVLHSRIQFPIERLEQITMRNEKKLSRIRFLYVPDFSVQEKALLTSEVLMVKENIPYLFFDSLSDNYLVSLSMCWNTSSDIKRIHSSFVRQMALLKAICLERGFGVLLTFNSEAEMMAVQRYALELWPDLILRLEQVEATVGKVFVNKGLSEEPEEVHEIIVKREGPVINWGVELR